MDDTPSPTAQLLTYEGLRDLLGPRPRTAHKGDFGHALVIGGDAGYGGAALMAAEAAARSGAGLISVATHPTHLNSFLSRRPELMVQGITADHQVDPLLQRASVIVLGPGLGQSEWSKGIFKRVIIHARQHETPMLLDADALNLLSQANAEKGQWKGQWNAERKACSPATTPYEQWILTPHPGEAARLLGTDTLHINQSREHSARALQTRYGGVSILKGAGSLIAYQDKQQQQLERCDLGNPGMASGGMGDVLSGLIGGLLAQGFSLPDAARLGVCIHAMSADKCAAQAGERGMLASDLIPWIRRLLNPHL